MADEPQSKPGNKPTHLFKPGQSGNPGGRPKGRGLAARIREGAGGDGNKLIRMYEQIAYGEIKATTKDRIEAGKVLLERGWGKAVDVSVSLSATAGEETMAALADGALEGLVRQLMSPGAPAALSAQAVDESVEDAVYTPIPSESLAPAPLSSRDAESPDVPSAPLEASVVPDKDRAE